MTQKPQSTHFIFTKSKTLFRRRWHHVEGVGLVEFTPEEMKEVDERIKAATQAGESPFVPLYCAEPPVHVGVDLGAGSDFTAYAEHTVNDEEEVES